MYEEPHHFAYDILIGFRQMAEPACFDVEIVPVDVQMQRNQHYDVLCWNMIMWAHLHLAFL